MLERRPRNGREGSHSGSSDYDASTSSLIENRYLNQTQKMGQFVHRERNKNYKNNEMIETSSDQVLHESMIRVPYRFYRQMTYDEQQQAYVFTETNALILAETSMYIILHEPTKINFRYNPELRQFR